MILRTAYLVTILLFWGCVDGTVNESDKNNRIFNPNGDSELALLMRDMYEDGMQVKQLVLEGRTPQINCDYPRIHTAHATQPEKVATPNFKAFAEAYENSAKRLLAVSGSERHDAYQAMVGACMSCHQSMCPGPMVKIKNMYLSERELQSLSESF